VKLIGKAQLHCQGIRRDANEWAVVSVSALYGASAAACAGKTRLVSGCRPSLLKPANLTLK